ncbi:MAG: hypothetical protein KAW09_08670, partial [Thermoplasmata archaeon]|nr:hypothetical protein [Thermoplasmata archaeon]
MMKTRRVSTTFATTIAISLVLFAILGMTPSASAQSVGTSNMTFSDTNPFDGDVVTISVTIFNNGTFPVSNITLTFYVDHGEIGNTTGINLEANSSSIQKIDWTAESGTHTIGAILSVNGMPVPDTEIGSEIDVALGEANTLIGALILIIAVVFITPLA